MNIRPNHGKTVEAIFFILLFILAISITFIIHKNKRYFTWESEIWADKAGYYIYLPATFYYKFDVNKAPDKIDDLTGNGFKVDHSTQKISTKYSYGVSLLISPFFIAAHYISKIFHIPQDYGFSPLYQKMMDIAAVFYLILGLWLLKKFLDKYYRKGIAYAVILLIFFGTNLFYYSLRDTLMSHVYSFFLVSLFLYSMKKFFIEGKYRYFILMSIAISLAFLVRYTNLLFLSLFFFWDIRSFNEFLDRLKTFLKPGKLMAFIGIVIVVFIPQMIYWKYLNGTYLFYSYGEEGFSNAGHPFIAEVLFSPLNGLIIYTPMVLLFIGGIICLIRKKQFNGWFLICLFIVFIYITASWHQWFFGCSFGQRTFVELYAVLAFPFGFLIQSLYEGVKKIMFAILLFFVLVLCTFNGYMTYRYPGCFEGSTWDWAAFSRMLNYCGILPGRFTSNETRNDFENPLQIHGDNAVNTEHHSGIYSISMGIVNESCCRYVEELKNFKTGIPRIVHASVWIKKPGTVPTEALLICSIERNGVSSLWQCASIDRPGPIGAGWYKIQKDFNVKGNFDPKMLLTVYIWNPKRQSFFVDDLDVKIE